MHPAVEVDLDHKLGVVTFQQHPRRHRPCGPGPEAMAERISVATLWGETVEPAFVDAALARLQESGVEPKDIAGIVRGLPWTPLATSGVDVGASAEVGFSCPGALPCPCSAPRTEDC